MTSPPLVLASGSPRRHTLLIDVLGQQGFTVTPGDIDEAAAAATATGPRATVSAVARAKASAAWVAGTTVVAADTVVVHDDRILGKPHDRADASRTLRAMRGDDIQVFSAVVVMGPRGARTDEVIRSDLTIGHPTDDEIDRYVASGAADDKAGGLAVQDAAASFVAEIRGCHTNVYGLPVCATLRLLRHAGYGVDADCPQCGENGGT